MAFCVMCGSSIPDDQGSKTCSMCYGDPGHGKDGYYQAWLDEAYQHQIDTNQEHAESDNIYEPGE